MMDYNKTCSVTKIFENAPWTFSTISFTVIEIIIAIVAIIGNTIVFIAFFRNRSLRHKINFYIISLALADFGVGLIGIPFGIFVFTTEIPEYCNDLLCLVPISTLLTLCNTSILCIVLISIKRLRILSLINPKPRAKLSKNIGKEIGICWLIGSFIGYLPIFWNDKHSKPCVLYNVLSKGYVIFRFTFITLIPSIIIGVIYFKIYKIIITQSKKLMEMRGVQKPSELYGQKFLKKEIKATRSISLIVLTFWITWMPLQILYLIAISCDDCIPKCVISYAVSFVHLNSAINPIQYAYRMRDIRRAIYKLFGVNTGEKSSFSEPSNINTAH